jgi:type II secretory pathway pseudopilin PulG
MTKEFYMSRNQKGFTVLELIIAVVFLAVIGTIFLIQDRNLQISQRDSQRKMAINAIYYNLEDVYYTAHSAYPQAITSDALPGVDPTILKDPDGVMIGAQNSNYTYTPKNCTNGACKSYVLRSTLEQEADYVKNSRNK